MPEVAVTVARVHETMTQPLHGLLGAMPEKPAQISATCTSVLQDDGDLTIHRGSERPSARQPGLERLGQGECCPGRHTFASDPSIDLLLFTGVAGAADLSLQQWDVVLADAVVQHDMDARPLFPRFTLPALNQDRPNHRRPGSDALRARCWRPMRLAIGWVARPSTGLIATGIASSAMQRCCKRCGMLCPTCELLRWKALPSRRWPSGRRPWLVLRVISDGADEAAAQSFEDFVKRYEQQAWRLIQALLQRCNESPQQWA